MRRLQIVLATLVVVGAACGAPADEVASRTITAQQLAYSYTPNTQLDYDFDMSLDMKGGFEVPEFLSEGAPQSMEFAMTVRGGLGYAVAAGPDPGTVRIDLDYRIDDIPTLTATADGVDMTDGIDFAADDILSGFAPLPTASVIVDEKGAVQSVLIGGEELPLDLFGGDLFSGNPFGSVGGFGNFLGPELPDTDITVGASWTSDHSQEVPLLGTTIRSHSTHRITDIIQSGAREIVIIETVTTMDPIKMTMADLMAGFADLSADDAAALGIPPSELGQIESEMESFGMEFSIDVTMAPATTTTWFDPSSGLMVKSDSVGSMNMTMVMSGDLFGGEMKVDFDVEFDVGLALSGAGTA